MFDHVTLNVQDFEKSKAFYEQLMASIGYENLFSQTDYCGFGNVRPQLWISQSDAEHPVCAGGAHVALRVETKEQVEAFHQAGIEAGGVDNGKPGIRERYAHNYFAAFIKDPDGNNIEVVTFL